MTDFEFYKQLDSERKDKKKPRYESKKTVLNQAQKIRLKNSSYILEWLSTKFWSTCRYASYSELNKHKLKNRISTRN